MKLNLTEKCPYCDGGITKEDIINLDWYKSIKCNYCKDGEVPSEAGQEILDFIQKFLNVNSRLSHQ